MPSFNASSLNSSDAGFNWTDALNVTDIDIQYSQPVQTAPVYLFCCALSLAAISAFLRAGFVLKFIAMICCIAVQGCILSLSKLFAFYDHETGRERFDTFLYFPFLFESTTPHSGQWAFFFLSNNAYTQAENCLSPNLLYRMCKIWCRVDLNVPYISMIFIQ